MDKLVKILNEFGTTNQKLADEIKASIESTKPQTWDALVENRNTAINIAIFILKLNDTLDVKHLRDAIQDALEYKDEDEQADYNKWSARQI